MDPGGGRGEEKKKTLGCYVKAFPDLLFHIWNNM